MFTECILAHHIHFMKMENCYSQLQEEKKKKLCTQLYVNVCMYIIYNLFSSQDDFCY